MDFKEEKDMEPGMESNFIQITSKRAVADDNFPKGVQDYDFTVGGRYAWVPCKSYFRVQLSLEMSDGAGGWRQPNQSDDIAFADDPVSCLYDNIYARAGGSDISSIVNYAPQASIIKNRLGKSGAWLNNIGKVAYGLNSSFDERASAIGRPGSLTSAAADFVAVSDNPLATVAIASVDGRLTGVNTLLNTAPHKVLAGDLLAVNGVVYRCVVAPTSDVGAAMVVVDASTNAFPAANIDATTDAFRLVPAVSTKASKGKNVQYFLWQPPIGLFDHAAPMGSGDYRIQLNPNSEYQRAAVQARASLTPGTDYRLQIKSVEMYVSLEKSNIPATMSEKLYLMECQIQSKNITASTEQLDFTIPPSTKSITVFVQALSGGTSTLFPSTLLKLENGEDEGLEQIQLTYGNVSKPSTKWSSSFSPNSNLMTQRYLTTQINSGRIWSEGGAESFDQWLERGAIYTYDFTRDMNDRSSHLQLAIKFSSISNPAGANVFVCSHFSRTVQIDVQNGRVAQVQTLSV